MATSPFPFPYQAAPPPFPAAASYPPKSPNPTQIHGYHHPSPFFYPSPTQIHGGLYPPPPYSGDYCSAPPTHPYPVPFLPHPCYQIHAPPAESTPPHTTVPPTTVQRTTHPLLPASDFSPPPPLAPTPPAPTREHPQPHPALHTSVSKVAAAQAQAQAAEEEQIRARLPREVLNTNRRLDHLQHSFDLLQSHASRLKEMVAQIVAALGKQPAPGTAPNSPAPSPKPATTTQSAASVSNEFYGVLSLQSSLCGRPKQQQHKEGGSGGDLTMGTNSSGTSINGKKPIDKQPGPEILSVDHFAPTPSSVLDLDKSYGWQSEIQQGNTSGSPALPVLGEMPTPSSWQGTTHGTTPPPHCCSRHNNPIQSPCVSDLSEQNLDEGSKQYDFHDLNIQSVFRADGTKHRYYALPEDYPLERAVPEPGFALYDDITEGDSNEYVFAGTNEYVDVFATTPEQQPYEEDTSCLNCMDKQLARHVHKASANAFSEQLLRCFSKQQETEPMSADVQDSTLQLQQQSGEMACNWPVLKASGSVVTSSNQLCIDHSMRELRLLWDPGASAFLVTPLKNSSIDFSSHDKTDLWAQYEHQFIVFREIVVEVMLDKPPAKPPDRFGIAESSLEVFLLKAKSENSSAYTHFNFLSCNIKQFSAVQARQDICFLLEAISSWKEGAFSLGNFAVSALWRNTTQVEDKTFGCLHIVANSQNLFSGLSRGDTENICISVKLSPWSIFSVQHILDSSMKKELIFSSGCILAGNPWSAILFLHYLFWEFSMDRVLSKTAVPHLVHRSEIPIKLLTFIEQPIALKHYMSHLLLQCHLWSQTQNAFPKVQYCCLPIVLDCLYSELVKQLGYSSLFSSTEICRSTTTVLMKLVWNSGKVAQEGRDEAVVYQVSKIQLPMRKISHVWELDILFITFLPP